MRCFVTGASGHLGSHLTRLLLERGHEVSILLRPDSDVWRIADVLSRIRVIRGDLADLNSVVPELVSASPEVVFHLAWHGVAAERQNDAEQISSNLIGSVRLLRAAQEAGCSHWVGLGSQAEYGLTNTLLREDLRPQPKSLYGVTKLCLSLLSKQLCATWGMHFVWLRLLATYGPKDDAQHLIPHVTLALLARGRLALSPGEQRWDYLYVEDAAEAIHQAAICPAAHGVFNLASGSAETVRNIVEGLRDLIDPTAVLHFGDIPYGPDGIVHLEADVSRLRSVIPWKPRVSLQEGLYRTVEWYRRPRLLQPRVAV